MPSKRERNTHDLIVVDLEATCWDETTTVIPKEEMEIIEIGAVQLYHTDATGWQLGNSFETFVRPVVHPTLSVFCKELTTITQAQVETAPTFDQALGLFVAWIEQTVPNRPYQLGSWGEYDKNQFILDSQRWACPLPDAFIHSHVNVKKEYAYWQGPKAARGAAKAVKQLGWTWEGTHHRGIDDARMIARITQHRLQAQASQPTKKTN